MMVDRVAVFAELLCAPGCTVAGKRSLFIVTAFLIVAVLLKQICWQ
jgi:hypothetical protein